MNEYPTDDWIMKIFETWFDPCHLSKGDLREFDGLGSSWYPKTFVNPPYDKPLPWVQKAIEEMKKGKFVVMLLKHDSSTKWYKLLHEANAKFLLVNGRLRHRTGKPAPFPSILAVLDPKENTIKDRDLLNFTQQKGDELTPTKPKVEDFT